MLSNAYFLAKFRFDTAENEPAKNLQNFANVPNFAHLVGAARQGLRRIPQDRRERGTALLRVRRRGSLLGGQIDLLHPMFISFFLTVG